MDTPSPHTLTHAHTHFLDHSPETDSTSLSLSKAGIWELLKDNTFTWQVKSGSLINEQSIKREDGVYKNIVIFS